MRQRRRLTLNTKERPCVVFMTSHLSFHLVKFKVRGSSLHQHDNYAYKFGYFLFISYEGQGPTERSGTLSGYNLCSQSSRVEYILHHYSKSMSLTDFKPFSLTRYVNMFSLQYFLYFLTSLSYVALNISHSFPCLLVRSQYFR